MNNDFLFYELPDDAPERARGFKYKLLAPYVYYSHRYNRTIKLPYGMLSDGATGALDVCPRAFFVHDRICNFPEFSDEFLSPKARKITAWIAANILSDILKAEGYGLRSRTWFWATFFFGCDKAKANGWF